MSKIYVQQMKLRRWFPANDRFAACVARLCILREDFGLEMWGIHRPRIKALDEHSVVWRRMYFWRNLVRTLWEIRRTIETLNTVPEFKKIFKTQPLAWRTKFERMVRQLEKHQVLVQNVRNSLGGHVLQRTVEEALNGMPWDKFSYIEVGRVERKTHYRFAGELVLEMLLAGVPEDKREDEIKRVFRTTAKLLPVFELTGIILTMYVSARKLVE
jgi:hypothetical protein